MVLRFEDGAVLVGLGGVVLTGGSVGRSGEGACVDEVIVGVM